MAINIRGIFKLNSLMKNMVFKSNFINVGLRSLYTERDLGITTYENTRFIFRNQFITIEEVFRNKMKDICNDESALLYTEDLKAMLHLVQNNEDDINLLIKMLEKYSDLEEEQRIGNFAFGPVVMRALYYLNKPELALNVFKNEKLFETFNYRSTHRILMCLLIKHNMYKEVREIYDLLADTKGLAFIGRNSVLMYLSCMKENTMEALEYGIERWRKEYEFMKPTRRSTALLSLLAIKQNHPDQAMQLLSVVERDRNITIKCLKILAFMHLEKYMYVIPLIKCTDDGQESEFKQRYFIDVVQELEDKVNSTDMSEKPELLRLIELIKEKDQIENSCTLEEYLCRPIQIPHKNLPKLQKSDMNPSYMPRMEQVGMKNYL